MKRKLFVGILVVILLMLSVSAVGLAEKKTNLPVTISYNNGYNNIETSILLKSFEITDMKYVDGYTQAYINIKFEILRGEFHSYDPLVLDCYDEKWNHVSTRDMHYSCYKKNSGEYTVTYQVSKIPSETIVVRIAPKYPKSYSQSYVYISKEITVYSIDGKTKEIPYLQLPAYESVGWYKEPVMIVYAPDGRKETIYKKDAEAYKAQGWYLSSSTTMYSIDGRETTVSVRDIYSYQAVGWYLEPFKTLYAADGRKRAVAESKVEAYKKVGWYTEPVATLYSIDGREIVVLTKDIAAYEAVGWYRDFYITMYNKDGGTILTLRSNQKKLIKEGWDIEPFVTLHALDGREIVVSAKDVTAYKAEGWYTEPMTTMYSLDYREIIIPTREVEVYKTVGWYTYDGIFYQRLITLCEPYKLAGNYMQVFHLLDTNAKELVGTNYEASLNAYRTEVMDLWRISCNQPMGYIGCKIGKSDTGLPTVTLSFRNVSYKRVVGYKVMFTCYNIYGEVVTGTYNIYNANNVNVGTGQTGSATWILYGMSNIKTITNVYLTEVVFDDGTKWVR